LKCHQSEIARELRDGYTCAEEETPLARLTACPPSWLRFSCWLAAIGMALTLPFARWGDENAKEKEKTNRMPLFHAKNTHEPWLC
jgi:hypothetical protein